MTILHNQNKQAVEFTQVYYWDSSYFCS